MLTLNTVVMSCMRPRYGLSADERHKQEPAPGDLTKFLDNMLHNTVVSFHSDLSSKRVSPWDTGRFAASWFVEGGESQVLSYKNSYTLSNPLPYAERLLCFGNWAVNQLIAA